LTLDQIEERQVVRVVQIMGGWGIRQRLNQMGIHPGDQILVKRSAFMGGPVLIQIHGVDVALGRGMTRKVVVEKI
jgi:ferrous iron transport protein A